MSLVGRGAVRAVAMKILSTADGLLGVVEYDYRLVILDPEIPGILYSLLPMAILNVFFDLLGTLTII